MAYIKQKCIVFVIALLIPAVFPQYCFSAKIAVITRENIVPYATFLEGFQGGFEQRSDKSHILKVFSISPPDVSDSDPVRREIAAFNPAIIVCIGSGSLNFSVKHFPGTPMIYSMVLHAPRFANHGSKHILGISMEPDILQKLKMIKRIDKNIKQIGTVYNPEESGRDVEAARAVAAKLGLQFEAVPIVSPKAAFNAVEPLMSRLDAFILFFDRTVLTPQTIGQVFTTSFRGNVPVIGLSEKYVRLGALFSIDIDIRKLGRETWDQTVSCLQAASGCSGARKASPDSWGLIINEKIAEKMNLSIPADVRREVMKVY